MNKNKEQNLVLNKKFLIWSKEADQKSDSTVKKRSNDLSKFTEFMGIISYKKLTIDRIISFKRYIKEMEFLVSTYCSLLRTIKIFLGWLMREKGYKRIITPDLIEYCNPTLEEKRMAQYRTQKNIISLESVHKLHDSISTDSPVGMRNCGIVSLMVTTGIRAEALLSLPVCALDIDRRVLHQNPQLGVKTKYRKRFESVICIIDDRYIKSLKEWINYLNRIGFGDMDPLFPRAKKNYDKKSHCFVKAIEVEPIFYKSHSTLSRILHQLCAEANIQYINPHAFRHLLVNLMKQMNLSDKQKKCFSQSIGHEHERTTWEGYGKFPENEVIQTALGIDFQKKSKKFSEEEMRELLLEMLRKYDGK